MKKYYSQPDLEIRKYSVLDGSVLTISTPEVGGGGEEPDLNDEDIYNPFG